MSPVKRVAPTEPREYSRIRDGPHGGRLKFNDSRQGVVSRQGACAPHRGSGLPPSGRDLHGPGSRSQRGSAASRPHPRPQSRHGVRADGSSRLTLHGAGATRAGADSVKAATLTARPVSTAGGQVFTPLPAAPGRTPRVTPAPHLKGSSAPAFPVCAGA
ncbi:hypothetical protein NDU88_000421 [Pleurodeles waltl]|uniref:Uncharacterized protein n=1 Tax=Pleurodeles waltl TaxID=8319 RepID=A0AAV7V8W3_PLEWA|nr:hypothetical protein NDU88_000421 [Pleurodeles waltl]